MDDAKIQNLVRLISTLSSEEIFELKECCNLDLTKVIVRVHSYDGSNFYSIKYIAINGNEDYATYNINGTDQIALLTSANELDLKVRYFFTSLIARTCKELGLPLSAESRVKRFVKSLYTAFSQPKPRAIHPVKAIVLEEVDPIERHTTLLQDITGFAEYHKAYAHFIQSCKSILPHINHDMKHPQEKYFITDQSYNIIYNNIKTYSFYLNVTATTEKIEASMLRQMAMLQAKVDLITKQYQAEQEQRILESMLAQEEMVKKIIEG